MPYSKTATNGSNFTSINNFAFFLLATIVLAGINDVDGIIIGGVLGHTICTGLAVIAERVCRLNAPEQFLHGDINWYMPAMYIRAPNTHAVQHQCCRFLIISTMIC